jgi:hypothetical protein
MLWLRLLLRLRLHDLLREASMLSDPDRLLIALALRLRLLLRLPERLGRFEAEADRLRLMERLREAERLATSSTSACASGCQVSQGRWGSPSGPFSFAVASTGSS